jgi:hypothetical protein
MKPANVACSGAGLTLAVRQEVEAAAIARAAVACRLGVEGIPQANKLRSEDAQGHETRQSEVMPIRAAAHYKRLVDS